MWDYLLNLLKEFLHGLGTLLWQFFTEFYQWAFDKLIVLIQGALNMAGVNVNLQWSSDLWAKLNFFFPINEGLALLTAVFLFWLAVFSVKVILKLIPTIY